MSPIYVSELHDALVNRVFSKVPLRTRNTPSCLYHYTTGEGVSGVLASSRFRATSAACSKDKKEITYGCDLFAQLIDRKMAVRKVSSFVGRILTHLKSMPRERVARIFLASFCEKDDCLTLWSYGGYSLRFLANAESGPFLSAPRGLATGQGFTTTLLPAIYDELEQETVLRSLLDLLIDTLEDPSLIADVEGVWAPSLANFISLTISDFALSSMVRLKNPKFLDEREWRIVVRPSHTAFSSDPTEGDRNCECYIKRDWIKPYVELSGPEPVGQLRPGTVFGLMSHLPELPIDAVRIGPCERSDQMAQRARGLLDKYRLETASVLKSEIPTSLDCN